MTAASNTWFMLYRIRPRMGELTLNVSKLRYVILKQKYGSIQFRKMQVGWLKENGAKDPRRPTNRTRKIHKHSKRINKNVQDVVENP